MGNHESALKQRIKARARVEARIEVLQELLEAQCTGCRLKMKTVHISVYCEEEDGQIHENVETGKLRFCTASLTAILMLDRERKKHNP